MDGRRTVRYTTTSSSTFTCESFIVVAKGLEVVTELRSRRHTTDQVCAMIDKLLPSVSAKIPD